MASAFPSLSAYGGSKSTVCNTAANMACAQSLATLNKGTARMVDTYIYPYDELVRNELPFARVANAGKDIRIAIIGAGFAGATAAHELKRAFGEHFTSAAISIFEAKTNEGGEEAVIGGRASSQYFKDSNGRRYVNEMGPMRVPENSKLFWHYLLKIEGDPKVIQEIFPNPGVVATQLVYRGVRYAWGGLNGGAYPEPVDPNDPNIVDWSRLVEDIFGRNGFVASLEFEGHNPQSIGQLLMKGELSAEDKDNINTYWQYFLLKFEAVSFVGALTDFFDGSAPHRRRWGGTEFNMFSTLGLGTGGFGPLFPVCFLEIFRLLLWQYDQEYSPSLSMADIVRKLMELDVMGNSEKISVRPFTVNYIGLSKDSGLPMISYVNRGSADEEIFNNTKSEVFDFVIVTAPLRSMQICMNLDANVPPAPYAGCQDAVFGNCDSTMIREAIRIPHVMNASKMFGFLPAKPWVNNEDWPHIHGDPIKCVLTDTLARQMYFLDPYPEEDSAGCNALISYNWGDDAVQIMAVRNYEQGQFTNPAASPDFVLKNAYQNGICSAIENSPIAETLNQITVANQYETLQSVIWQEEPMIFGGFKIDYPQQYYYTVQMVYQYQQADQLESTRVFLAGNNVSFQGGWIEGAMQSAVNAASAVLKVMERLDLLEPDSFRMESLFQANPFPYCKEELAKKYRIIENECA